MAVKGVRKRFIALLLVLLSLLLITGCAKDEFIGRYNDAIELVGDVPISWNPWLKGERAFGSTHYTGSYEAEYAAFTGTEFLFGGTSLETVEEGKLSISCVFEATKGEAELVFYSIGGEPTVLAGSDAPYEDAVELPVGSNYIAVRGKDFTGTVTLKIE